jgi:hypothetical protein
MPEKIAEKDQSEVSTYQSGFAFLTTLMSRVQFVKNNLKPFLRIGFEINIRNKPA